MLNLPNTSYRDIVIHGNDLIVGTYGRGMWVLDGFPVLRQMASNVTSQPAHLFEPSDAVRVRRNVNADTPFPPEVPHALNPPDGVIVDYYLASAPSSYITLDVLDASGGLVRHMTSAPGTPVPEAAVPPEPNFWIAPPFSLPANAGENRTNWDLRYDAPPAFEHSFEINANPGLTPTSPEGILAPPGVYTLRLTVDGRSYTQKVTVKNDPRSPATLADVNAEHELEMRFYDAARESWNGYNEVEAVRHSLAQYTAASAPPAVAAAAKALDAKLDSIGGSTGGRGRGGFGGFGGAAAQPTFVTINGAMDRQIMAMDNADIAPNGAMRAAYAYGCSDLRNAVTRWKAASGDVATFNSTLRSNNLQPIAAPQSSLQLPACPAVPEDNAGRAPATR